MRSLLLGALLILGVAAGASAASAQTSTGPTIEWVGAGDATSWDDPANWTPARVPGAGDVVLIPDVERTSRVVIDYAMEPVASVESFEALSVRASAVVATNPPGGRFTVHRESSWGGHTRDTDVVAISPAILWIGRDTTFRGVRLTGRAGGGEGNLTVYGDLHLDGEIGYVPITFIGDDVAITGAARIRSSIFMGAGGRLVLSPGVTTIGRSSQDHVIGGCASTCGATIINRGTVIGEWGVTLGAPGQRFVNEGTILAGQEAYVIGTRLAGSWTNAGTMVAEDFTVLTLGGTFRTEDIGVVVRDGGRVVLGGTLDNRGATLDLRTTTGRLFAGYPYASASTTRRRYAPPSGTIQGGVVVSDEQAPFVVVRGLLDGVELQGPIKFHPEAWLHVTNGLTFTGEAVRLPDSGFYLQGPVVYAHGTQTIAGAARIEADLHLTTGTALTLGPEVEVTGWAGPAYDQSGARATDTRLVNQGRLITHGVETHGFLNLGVVRVPYGLALRGQEETETTPQLTWRNEGQIILDERARLKLMGSYSTDQIGSVDGRARDAGVYIDDALDNRGATLDLTTFGQSYLQGTITGGRVTGGSLRTSVNSDKWPAPLPRLRDVALETDMDVWVMNPLVIEGSFRLDGHLKMYETVWLQTDRVDGTGTLTVRSTNNVWRGDLRFGDHLRTGPELSVVVEGDVYGGELIAGGPVTLPDAPWNAGVMEISRLVINGGLSAPSQSGGRITGTCVNQSRIVAAEAAWLQCGSLEGNGSYELSVTSTLAATSARGRAIWITGTADVSGASLAISSTAAPQPDVGTVVALIHASELRGSFGDITSADLGDRALQVWQFPNRLHAQMVPDPAPPMRSSATPPDGPWITRVTTADGAVEVAWNPPANNGGLPVSSYIVWARLENSWDVVAIRQFDASARRARLTGLQNGRRYLVYVEASTAGGAQSSYRVVTPSSTPSTWDAPPSPAPTPSPTPSPSPSPSPTPTPTPAPTPSPVPDPTESVPASPPGGVSELSAYLSGNVVYARWKNPAGIDTVVLQQAAGVTTPAWGSGVFYRGTPVDTFTRRLRPTQVHQTFAITPLNSSTGLRGRTKRFTLRASHIRIWQRALSGSGVSVRGRALDATTGRPVPHKQMTLQIRRDGAYRNISTVRSNREGRFRMSLIPRRTGAYRWRMSGQGRRLTAVSRNITLTGP